MAAGNRGRRGSVHDMAGNVHDMAAAALRFNAYPHSGGHCGQRRSRPYPSAAKAEHSWGSAQLCHCAACRTRLRRLASPTLASA